MKNFVLVLFTIMLTCHYGTFAQLITYKAPEGSQLNSDFTVKVRQSNGSWQPLATYMATVVNVVDTKSILQKTSFAYFDFAGKVEVQVTYNKGIVKQARIRPLSKNIPFIKKGNTLSFALSAPQNLSVEINGNIFQNLQLFANAIETYKPSPADTNVIYFGPGIHRIGVLKVPSNKTVYIAGGAIVHGGLIISNVENVRVLGHGILTQLPVLKGETEQPAAAPQPGARRTRNDEITVEFSKNVEVNGITVLPHKYSILIGSSTGVKVSNFKSFSSEGNADGLDIFCSSDVTIDNIFMRNSDDCIAIYGHRWAYYGNTKNVTVKNSILWADVAHPIVIGTHGDPPHPDTLGNMTFSNLDILDQHENQLDYQGCLALNAGDDNLIDNIRFEDVRIEDIRKGQLINLRIMFNRKYNTSPGRGIQNIYFKNLSYQGRNANMSVITGYNETRSIKNITFENLTINGTTIYDTMPGKPAWYKTGDMDNFFIGEHVEGVKFIK